VLQLFLVIFCLFSIYDAVGIDVGCGGALAALVSFASFFFDLLFRIFTYLTNSLNFTHHLVALCKCLSELCIIRPFIEIQSFNPRHEFPKESFNLFYKRRTHRLFGWREIVVDVLI
jgi:hypothetical protein